MTEIEPWTCPSCRAVVVTPYCPACGERLLDAGELSLRGLVHQVIQSFTKIDGRLLRSFRCLVSRPGALTVAYLDGQRRPYLGPVGLFLTANVLFFAAEALTGGTIFSTPLASHLHTQPWSGDIVERLVSDRMQVLQTTMALYAPRFDGAIALHARSLILLMALSFAAAPWIAFRRSGRPFVTHAVFSLHLYGFLLLLFSVATAIPAAGMPFGGVRSTSEPLDRVLSVTLLLACAAYMYVATGVVYGGRGSVRVLKSIALTLAVAAIILGYRFALFLITLYSA